jgi:hypothetical protein
MYQNTSGSFLPSSQVMLERPPLSPASLSSSWALAGLYS